ncbi:hypothetical protein [Nonomuraea sp. B5E05]|uniref:hypothetical protein n=1 Tax=Nonomuraea sp. B5E05 TaxID=3153569 RepID=UPI00325FFCC3
MHGQRELPERPVQGDAQRADPRAAQPPQARFVRARPGAAVHRVEVDADRGRQRPGVARADALAYAGRAGLR